MAVWKIILVFSKFRIDVDLSAHNRLEYLYDEMVITDDMNNLKKNIVNNMTTCKSGLQKTKFKSHIGRKLEMLYWHVCIVEKYVVHATM